MTGKIVVGGRYVCTVFCPQDFVESHKTVFFALQEAPVPVFQISQGDVVGKHPIRIITILFLDTIRPLPGFVELAVPNMQIAQRLESIGVIRENLQQFLLHLNGVVVLALTNIEAGF